MSLLTIITAVCAELSLVQPAAVIGSTDRQVQQLLALANLSAWALANEYDWQALRIEQDFVTVAAAQQPTAIPADFDRFVNNSFFNRTTRRPVNGPLTPRQYQWILAQPVYGTVYLTFIERGGQFLMAPTPPAGQTIAFEYISTNWCKAVGGAFQSQFLADTDVALISEDLIRLALKWRFKEAKGLDYEEAFNDYERAKERAESRDGGATALSIAPQPIDFNRANIPDGSFGI